MEFSRDLILPLEANGEVDESKTMIDKIIQSENGTQVISVPYRVEGGFNVVASDWNDLLVGIDLQPFVLAEKRNNKDYHSNFQFAVNKAVLELAIYVMILLLLFQVIIMKTVYYFLTKEHGEAYM